MNFFFVLSSVEVVKFSHEIRESTTAKKSRPFAPQYSHKMRMRNKMQEEKIIMKLKPEQITLLVCTLDVKKKIFLYFNFDGDVRSNKLAALYYSFSHQFKRQMPYTYTYVCARDSVCWYVDVVVHLFVSVFSFRSVDFPSCSCSFALLLQRLMLFSLLDRDFHDCVPCM